MNSKSTKQKEIKSLSNDINPFLAASFVELPVPFLISSTRAQK